MKKLLLIGSVVLVSVAAVQGAVLPGCPTVGASIGANYSSIANCVVTDKTFSGFTKLSGTNALPADWRYSIDLVGLEHIVQFSRSGGSTLSTAGGPYGVQYQIDVVGMFISKVNINTDSSSSSAKLEKWVYSLGGVLLGSGTSLGGSTTFAVNPASAHVLIKEKLTIISGTSFSSFTDAYTQVTPEPATYAMMGLGLAALGLIARRKKA